MSTTTTTEDHGDQPPLRNNSIANKGNQIGHRDFPDKLDSVTAFDAIGFLREEIRFEHSLLGYRIAWLLASNAFLFTAFAYSYNKILDKIVDGQHLPIIACVVPFFLIPFVGLFVSIWILPAVREAADRIDQERAILYDKNSEFWSIIARLRPGPGDKGHNVSLRYARRMPYFLGCVWALVLVYGVILCSLH